MGEAGYDAKGRPCGWRQVDRREGVLFTETSRRLDGAVEVKLAAGVTARTDLDEAGRPVQTSYTGANESLGSESYFYDGNGRLAGIEESAELWQTITGSERGETGGRLSVQYNEEGLSAIVDAQRSTIWERPTVPWETRLSSGAAAMADECRELLAEAVAEIDLGGAPETYGTSLVYVDQGSLHAIVAVGLEADRRAAGDGEDGALATLYIEGNLPWIDEELASEELEAVLLREASMCQPDDPYRVVLGAVARRLSDDALSGLRKTDDFVAWVAEHDEGLAEKISSIRLHNAPEAVARWERGWGRSVMPYLE